MTKSYIYSNGGQIIAQKDGNQEADEYFYVTDRLGSVRQVVGMVDDEPNVVADYTYNPFGQIVDSNEAVGAPANNFLFTGQWYDAEISQYYLRARMYDPNMMRFTARDLVSGKQQNPLTIHVYLYCLNDPINRIDLNGRWSSTTEVLIAESIRGGIQGGLGGAVEGIIIELYDWGNGGEFEMGEVWRKIGGGVAIGALMGIGEATRLGTHMRTTRYNREQRKALFQFVVGVGQGVLQDLWKKKKGGAGLNKLDAGITIHNMQLDAMIASME